MQSSSYLAALLWPFLCQQWRSWPPMYAIKNPHLTLQPPVKTPDRATEWPRGSWAAAGEHRQPQLSEKCLHTTFQQVSPHSEARQIPSQIFWVRPVRVNKWMFPQGLVVLRRVWSTGILLCWSLSPSMPRGMSSSMVEEFHPLITQQGSVCLHGGYMNNKHSWPDLAAVGGQEERGRKTGSKQGNLSLFIWLSMVEKSIFWFY